MEPNQNIIESGDDLAQNSTQHPDSNVEKQESTPGAVQNPGNNDEAFSTVLIEHKTRQLHGYRWVMVCIALYVICVLYGLDTTIAADVQGSVTQAFEHVDQLAWIGAGFPLGSVCVILLLGTLYNTFNVKWTLIATTILFEIGSALCGAAPNMNALIVGRVLAGAGGSGIYLGSLQYFAVMTADKERGFYMSLIGVSWGLGAVLGPVIGGAFSVSSATWRWAFYINLVFGAIFVPIMVFYLPAIHVLQGFSIEERVTRIDWLGFVLGSGVWVSFLMALTMAGGQWPWDDGRNIATFVVFGVVLTLYILQQYFAILTTPERRAFPCHLLRDRTEILLYITTAAGTTTLFIVVYYIPLYFQFVNGDAALMAAVRLLPFMVIAVVVNLLSGSFLHFTKVYMVMYLIAGITVIAGGAPLVVYLDPDTSTGTIYGLTVLVAVGTGLSMTLGYTIATLTLDPEHAGSGLKLQNIAQIGGQVIALGIANQIYQSTAFKKLSVVLDGQGYSETDIRSAVAGAQSSIFEDLSGELHDKAVRAVAAAMRSTFVMLPVAGAVLSIAAVCMKREKLFGKAVVAGG
ncbi:hypothetical protein N0V82_004401 [Gnomoniopsis sp. IMI 355080]|nr:hypothetical protein N0V82_004401 [Gnomoniopsis sp. IMI 355080]